MKHICCSSFLFVFLLLTSSLFANKQPSVALFYADDISGDFIAAYDWIVVDTAQTNPIWAKRYPNKLFAYVSVGEYEKWRHKKEIPKEWKLAKNRAWDSEIVDISNLEYQNFLLSYMQTLVKQGYKNFFLDTLDAVFSVAIDKTKQTQALSTLLKKMKKRFPNAKFIANRGVEVMDTLCHTMDGFAIESLYKGIDANAKTYIDVPPKDASWIRAKLNDAKNCNLTPIVIDYLPPSKTKERLETAKKIADEGYVPYLTDIYLKHFGTGVKESIKREVLLLYDSSFLKDGDKVYSSAHLMSSMPLEYLGFIPILKDIKDTLPYAGVDRYAGVIIWPSQYMKDIPLYKKWLKKLLKEGQKVLFINDFGIEPDSDLEKLLHIKIEKSSNFKDNLFSKILQKDKNVGIELPAMVNDIPYSIKADNAKTLIKAQNSSGDSIDAMALTPWGGYGIGESCVRDIDNEPMWIVDPFYFFKKGLQLPSMPIPDPTTQNGRRVMFIHIDGDGFIEKARFDTKKYAAQVLYHDILKRYKLPHSISIIEGEIGEKGLYKDIAPKMQRIARDIYELPFVEIASHSFSHPFKWQKLAEGKDDGGNHTAYHLPIPNYTFSLKRELLGSVNFINDKLSTTSKKCKLFFWTGDCLPRADALEMSEMANLETINGGDTTITSSHPYLGRNAPFGLQRGDFWQTYCGMQNENIYTNDWHGPFWGYKDVIQTFNLTNKPRRIKPVNIYYHFYSASKIASLDALKAVYDWTQKQKLLALFTSEYIPIVQDFYATSIEKVKDTFIIKNKGKLRTLRIEKSLGYPDIENSKGVIGFKDEENARFISLDTTGEYILKLKQTKPSMPYLIESNAQLKSFKKNSKEISFKLKSHVLIEATFYVPNEWKVDIKNKINNKTLKIKSKKSKVLEVHFVKK